MSRELDELNKKIEQQKQIVFENKDRYDASVEKLNDLLQRRNALRNADLIKAIEKSRKSYEEVIRFLRGDDTEEDL